MLRATEKNDNQTRGTNGDGSLACPDFRLLVSATNQRPFAHGEALNAIDSPQIRNMEFADFVDPHACIESKLLNR